MYVWAGRQTASSAPAKNIRSGWLEGWEAYSSGLHCCACAELNHRSCAPRLAFRSNSAAQQRCPWRLQTAALQPPPCPTPPTKGQLGAADSLLSFPIHKRIMCNPTTPYRAQHPKKQGLLLATHIHTCSAVEGHGMPVLQRQQAQHAINPVPGVLEEQLANETKHSEQAAAAGRRDSK